MLNNNHCSQASIPGFIQHAMPTLKKYWLVHHVNPSEINNLIQQRSREAADIHIQ